MKLPLLPVWSAVALAFILVGCATETMPTGLSPVVPASVGLPPNKTVELTIYRPRKLMGFGLRPTVRMNGQDLVTVTNGTVFHTRLAPGRYLFDVDGHKSGAELDAKAGETYYFLVSLEPGIFAGNGVLTLVAPQQGAFESKSLPPVDKDHIDAPSFR
jgi:hypothetical protein